MKRLLITAAALASLGMVTFPGSSMAGTSVGVSINIGDPYRGAALHFRSEPDVVLVPDTRVYYVRDYDYDVYRYGSYWYYNYDGGWYRARRYDGPYVYVGYQSVPRSVAYVPVRYRRHWRESPGQGHAYGHRKARGWNDNDEGNGRGRGRRGHGNDNDEGNGHGRGH